MRRLALGSLVDADALPALAGALDSPHADVRVRAAKALARHGDRRALAPLLALATAPEPAEKERERTGSTWRSRPWTGWPSWAIRPRCRT